MTFDCSVEHYATYNEPLKQRMRLVFVVNVLLWLYQWR